LYVAATAKNMQFLGMLGGDFGV
jgi:hypothetical protein